MALQLVTKSVEHDLSMCANTPRRHAMGSATQSHSFCKRTQMVIVDVSGSVSSDTKKSRIFREMHPMSCDEGFKPQKAQLISLHHQRISPHSFPHIFSPHCELRDKFVVSQYFLDVRREMDLSLSRSLEIDNASNRSLLNLRFLSVRHK